MTTNERTETRTMNASEAGLMVAYIAGRKGYQFCPTITNGRQGWSLVYWNERFVRAVDELTDDASVAAHWVSTYETQPRDRYEIKVKTVVDVTATPDQFYDWDNQPYGQPTLYWP